MRKMYVSYRIQKIDEHSKQTRNYLCGCLRQRLYSEPRLSTGSLFIIFVLMMPNRFVHMRITVLLLCHVVIVCDKSTNVMKWKTKLV